MITQSRTEILASDAHVNIKVTLKAKQALESQVPGQLTIGAGNHLGGGDFVKNTLR